MSLIHQYIMEFNKLVSNINFLSTSNDVTIKNKLFLIQQDINEQVDFDTFECQNFLSNIYNILNQSSEPKSPIVASCVDVLQKAVSSRNKTIKKIMKDISFLPAITKLLWFVQEDNYNDNLIKLLILIKNLIMLNNELDEHNLKVFIQSLRDLIENFNHETITKLSLHILANLAMCNESAKYFINRSIKSTEVQEKIDKSSDLIGIKFLIITMGEFLPKDIPHLIKLSIKNIKECMNKFDSEPIIHSIDLLKYVKNMFNDERYHISQMEDVMNLFGDLNDKLALHFNDDDEYKNEMKVEYLENILNYYSLLLECDNKLVHYFEKFTADIYECSKYTTSASGLKYLSNFIICGGTFSCIDKCIESIIEYFINNVNSSFKNSEAEQNYEFLKFLKILHQNEKLDNTHFKAALEYMETTLAIFEDCKIENVDEDVVQLLVYSLQTLYALSQDSSLFRECLNKILDNSIVPHVITKAFKLQNEEILKILFSLTSIEKFPNSRVASLMAKSAQINQNRISYGEVKSQVDKSTSKYITPHLLNELDDLIKRINQKLDNNDIDLKSSDLICLFRQKNNYLQDHLTSVTEALNRYSDHYNEMQKQNCILKKLCEKQEVMNWSLQLDKEKYLKENQKLETENAQLATSVTAFNNKIDKEITQNYQMRKQVELNEMEIRRLKSEKSSMESEKQKFRLAQKENEMRIQELKQSLEEEKNLRQAEVSNALAEQKRIAQNAEKEHAKFQEVIKINENDLIQKQQRITALEAELKEAEKIQTSILSIMQKSKNVK